jgi:PAS domain S-box-containing protein
MTAKNTELEDTAPSSSSGQALRRRAEEIFLEKTAALPENLEALSPKEIRWTLHELRVHQIELEMQNEELRRAQAELDAVRAQYFDLYDLAPVGYLVLSEQGLILEANLTAATLLGEARGALVKQPISRFILPEDRDIYYRHRKQLFETSEPQECELRMVNKDGTTFWAWLEATVAQDADGAFVCRVMLSDITERKRGEEALRESEERYRTLIENVGEGIGFVNPEEQFAFANAAAEDIFDVPPSGLLGHSLYEFARPEQFGMIREQTDRRRAGEKSVYEIEISRPNGEKRNLLITAVPQFDSQGQFVGAFGVFRDITERKRAEEAVRRKAKELQEKNDELNRFTYAVSHDLRSPLVTIRTFQGQLEQDLRSQDAARIEMDLGYIRNAADKMSRLLDELLRLSRVGRITNPSEEASLQAIIKEALDLVAGRITGRGVKVQVTEEPVVLTGDRTRLVEVFMNLVDNAAKFMGDQPAPRVEIGVEQVGEELALFVRDNGIGIDPRLQPMLFGLFHKLDPGSEGTGIGLALVRRIVEVHGGRIWVESEGPGKGTTFRFTLAKTRRGVGRIS